MTALLQRRPARPRTDTGASRGAQPRSGGRGRGAQREGGPRRQQPRLARGTAPRRPPPHACGRPPAAPRPAPRLPVSGEPSPPPAGLARPPPSPRRGRRPLLTAERGPAGRSPPGAASAFSPGRHRGGGRPQPAARPHFRCGAACRRGGRTRRAAGRRRGGGLSL